MSDVNNDPDSGAAAMDIALDHARSDPALAATVETYLNRQIKLSELQEHHMRLRHISDLGRIAFQASLGILAMAVVVAAGAMVWNAARSGGYVIESFAVPPDLAARGLSGEVVAARVLDRLKVVATPSPNSVNAAQAVSSSSADNVKVEIPQTGISLGELYRFLRRWLGDEMVVSGEVVRQDSNVAVGVRINGGNGVTYQGPEADLDALLQKAAEHVFGTIHPTLYANWLMVQRPQRAAEAQAVRQRVLADPASTPWLRASAWNGLSIISLNAGDLRATGVLLRRAREADPTYALGFTNGVNNEISLSRPEAALALLPQALAVLEKHHEVFSPAAVISIRAQLRAQEAELRGDYVRAVAEGHVSARSGFQPYGAILNIAVDRARLHDGGAAAWLAEQPRPASFGTRTGFGVRFGRSFEIEAALQHWPRVIAMAAQGEKITADASFSKAGREQISTSYLRPLTALAKARTGDIAGAEKLAAAAPADCYNCVRIRGMIASEARQWPRADFWFARAAADAPSIPFAHDDWGRSLLLRGKPDDAITQFTLANRKAPKFADPLEGWGEALMAQNQSHLALAKFAQAEKFAPNWGRLHLKWGEALLYVGKKDEAKKQFAIAARLDLTPSEKSALAKVRR